MLAKKLLILVRNTIEVSNPLFLKHLTSIWTLFESDQKVAGTSFSRWLAFSYCSHFYWGNSLSKNLSVCRHMQVYKKFVKPKVGWLVYFVTNIRYTARLNVYTNLVKCHQLCML